MCLNIFCVNNDLTMSRRTRIVRVAVLGALTIAPSMAAADATGTDGPVVVANNNADRAGVTADRTVTVRLRAAKGRWQPEGPGRPTLTIDAFGEEGKPLMVPGPLVRVREGTTLAFSAQVFPGGPDTLESTAERLNADQSPGTKLILYWFVGCCVGGGDF